ncbi:short-chain dehydrogenase [Halobacteriales archaeon SW_8_65_20]|nr:MAG: short-chain dehydrogenase [Halobacteriales archaeon SW_8_65_20]
MELYDDLGGQVALVTGAESGIGAQIARNLDGLGATVYASARSMDAEVPDGCEKVLLDVTQEGDIEAIADGVFAEVGRLDILVNSAAVGGSRDDTARSAGSGPSERTPGGDIVAEPVRRIDRTLATNLRGPMLVCKHLVPLLVQRDGGRVVNVSSEMGRLSGMDDGSPAYRVSKAGLNGLTAYLHGEYNDQGLLANAACPEPGRTSSGDENTERSIETAAVTPTWLCRFTPGGPSGALWRENERIDW